LGTIVSQSEVDMITRFRVSDLLSHRKGYTMAVTGNEVQEIISELVFLSEMYYGNLSPVEARFQRDILTEKHRLVINYIEALERRCGERE
jgi:hypothetical protein